MKLTASISSENKPRTANLAQAMSRISRLGMSPRQQALNRLWAWYRTEAYAARGTDWNGNPATDPVEHEAIASQGFIPPGFYDAGESLPLKFRKPTAPYSLIKVIVDRFTGLLFSEQHHPAIEVDGDEQTEDFLRALATQGRLWPLMIQARTYGGAMGTVALGFEFINGEIEFEAHDPRWCKPTFKDRAKLALTSLEKRYMYPEEEIDPEGHYVTNWFWYRRVVDEQMDVVFKPAPVGEGDEPAWEPLKMVEHGLDFCPVVWVQNLPVQDDIDGDPDCLGTYDMMAAVDALIAQGHKGTISNCDPTVVISTDAQLPEVRKGSDNAIKLPNGGTASYMEISGGGPKTALELAKDMRGFILEVAQCVLEHPAVTNRTATEIEKVYSSMVTKTDVMREQYGTKGIKVLLDMAMRAAQKFAEPTIDPTTGLPVRGEVRLPPRIVTDESGAQVAVKRVPGKGGQVNIRWPAYFIQSLADTELAVRAAIAAKSGKLIDQKHAVRFVADFFRVEDVPEMMAQIERDSTEDDTAMAVQALGLLRSPGVPGGG